MTGLERRYRRLLTFWYPVEHRRRYEGEMLAVLMAGAKDGQRWPSVRDAANLAGHGLRARFSAAGTGVVSPAWADAAAATALLAALVLLSQRVVRVLEHMLLPGPDLPLSLAVRAAAWAAVVVAVLAGWRRVAAGCAWLTVVAEGVLFGFYYDGFSRSAVGTLAPLLLGVLAAAALIVPAPRRRAFAVLGGARLGVFTLAVAVAQGLFLVEKTNRGDVYDGGLFYVFYGLEASSQGVLYLMMGILAVAGIAALVVVASLPRPVRLRVGVLVAPVVAVVTIVELGTDGALGEAFLVRWLVLAGVPLVTLTATAAVMRSLERRGNGGDASGV